MNEDLVRSRELRLRLYQLKGQVRVCRYNLSHPGHTSYLETKMNEARDAADAFLLKATKKSACVDLHGLLVAEAIWVVKHYLLEYHRLRRSTMSVVVGKGLHSKDKIPKLKPAVEECLEELGVPYRYPANNSGLIRIDIQRLRLDHTMCATLKEMMEERKMPVTEFRPGICAPKAVYTPTAVETTVVLAQPEAEPAFELDLPLFERVASIGLQEHESAHRAQKTSIVTSLCHGVAATMRHIIVCTWVGYCLVQDVVQFVRGWASGEKSCV